MTEPEKERRNRKKKHQRKRDAKSDNENMKKTLKSDIQLCGSVEMARELDLEGVRHVDRLVQEGVITPTVVTENGRKVRKYDKDAVRIEYIRYLRDRINRRRFSDEDMEKKLDEADLRYKEAKAGKLELELAELEGQMHRAEDVETITQDLITEIRSAILSLPGRLAVDTADAQTPTEASGIIKAAVDELLNEIAQYGYNKAEYRKLVREREKWIGVQEVKTEKQMSAPAQTKKTATKGTVSKKTTAKKTQAKKATSKKQPVSSKDSAKTSVRRKT